MHSMAWHAMRLNDTTFLEAFFNPVVHTILVVVSYIHLNMGGWRLGGFYLGFRCDLGPRGSTLSA